MLFKKNKKVTITPIFSGSCSQASKAGSQYKDYQGGKTPPLVILFISPRELTVRGRAVIGRNSSYRGSHAVLVNTVRACRDLFP